MTRRCSTGPRGDRIDDANGGPTARRIGRIAIGALAWIAVHASALALVVGWLDPTVAIATPPEPAGERPATRASPTPLTLTGTWYVLVHYRDTGRDGATPTQWDDEIWRIEERRDGLSWTRYPHVALHDRTGRFERLSSGAEGRTTGAWSPSAEQLEEIRGGLVLDDHESRRKRLRPTGAGGYASADAMRPTSANAAAYAETWEIEGPVDRPVFVRRAEMGSLRGEPARGSTTFTTREVLDAGGELRGDYESDGHLVGRFRMIRTRVAGGDS